MNIREIYIFVSVLLQNISKLFFLDFNKFLIFLKKLI